jgi:hypothetical protein
MKKLPTYIILILMPLFSISQEFNCNIQVMAPQVQGTDRGVYDNMRTSLYEFVNNRNWTNYSYKPEERIECSILITINDRLGADEFKGTMNIQLRRPVYRTSYNTVMLNFIDKDVQFKYVDLQTLEFNDNAITSNLTAMVAYYCYVFLGYDFDSFSINGGTPFFEKAQNIVNMSQNSPEKGWKSFESQKNRYDNVETGRTSITESIELIRKAYREKPGLFSIQLFMDAKSDEIVNVFSKAAPQDKARIIGTLIEIDPSNASKYQGIMNTN